MRRSRTRSSWLLVTVLALALAPAQSDAQAAGGRRVMTVDDLFSIEQFGDATPSPDGAWLAYVIKRQPRTASGYKRDFMQGHDYADVWIVPTAGGAPRNITNGAADGAGYFAPVWSPDSKRLALLSTKSGNVHLWSWDRATGQLRQLIADRASAGVAASGIVWLDNTHLATTVLPPGDSPGSWIVEKLPAVTLMQAWPKAWKGQEATASVLDAGLGERPVTHPKRELRLVDVERATSKPLTTGDVGMFALSPDRRRIALGRRVATYQPMADARVSSGLNRDRYEIAVYSADGAEVAAKIAGIGSPRAGLGAPQIQWSDDGTQLALFARFSTLEHEPVHPRHQDENDHEGEGNEQHG